MIILVCILYAIPLIRTYQLSGPPSIKRIDNNQEGNRSYLAEPLYSESFINDEIADIQCHASSITSAGKDRMVSVWYAGSREGAKDVALYRSFLDEKKNSWSSAEVLINRENSSGELKRYVKKIGNPVIFSDKKDRLYLFYSTVSIGGWSGASVNYKVSLDRGVTWTASRKMVLSPFLNLTNNVKNKGIVLDDGSIVLPVYHEFIKKYSQMIRVRPDTYEVTYKIKKATYEHKAIQPSILPADEKGLVAFFRNMDRDEKKYILMAESNDLGNTWTGLQSTTLPHPNSGFDMIRLRNGTYLGAINKSFDNRDNLTLVISSDRGRTWKDLKVIENNPDNEYSYPSISRSEGGLYHMTYTYERKRVKHVVFNEAWIKSQTAYDD
jgi:predicted neuraminidase